MAEESAVDGPYFCCVRNGFIAEIRSISWSVADEHYRLQYNADAKEKLQTDFAGCKYCTVYC